MANFTMQEILRLMILLTSGMKTQAGVRGRSNPPEAVASLSREKAEASPEWEELEKVRGRKDINSPS